MTGIQMNGFPTQGTPMDPATHPDTNTSASGHPEGVFQSTIGVGDYAMPRAGNTNDYKVKGKDK